jgi:tight adherence protein B
VNRLRLGKPGRILAATLVLGATVLGSASGAGADGTGPKLTVTQLDSGLAGNGQAKSSAELFWLGNPTTPAVTVTENGQPVKLDGAPTQLTRDRAVVFVIDSGPGMNEGDLLPHVRDTILAQVRAFPSIEYAVVQAGDRADIRANFTREAERIATAVAAVGPTKGSAVWDGVNRAASMLAERANLQPNIILVTADDDTVAVDGTAAAAARGSVAASTAAVANVAYSGRGSHITDAEPYELLSQTTGTAFAPTTDREALLANLRGAVTAVGERQYRVGWSSSAPAGDPLHIDIAVGDEHREMDVIAGRGLYRGYAQLQPAVAATTPFAFAGMDNPLVLGLALLLVLLGVAGAAYAVTTSLVRNDLSNVLEPYADAYKLMDGDTEEQGSSMVAKSAFLQRAVALTEQVAENQGLLTRAEGALERANLPLRAGEAMFAYVVLVVALTVIPLVLTKNLVPVLIFGALGAVVPLMVVSQIAKKRRKAFMGQLPDTLSLLSGTLKAGYSLMQGVEAVSQEISGPMGLELRRVVTESRLGRPLEESLEASADRMDSPDFEWAVMAIRIQREVGGNLAELLMTVGDTMVARERLRRDVAALTAEGRVSAYMLAAMPPILAAVMYVLNKEYVSILFTDVVGMFMVGLATLSMIIGFFWMKKIITIEI